jgi:hypothetical protein
VLEQPDAWETVIFEDERAAAPAFYTKAAALPA